MSSRSRSNRLATTAGLVVLSIGLGGGIYLAGDVFGEPLLEYVAIGVAVTGAVVFAPLFLLFTSWLDETEEARSRGR